MKKIYSIIAGLLLTVSVFAQAPQKMSYQAVIRNSSNALLTSTPVGMQISVLQGSSTGTPVYVETQTPTTNANGLVSIEIGTGTVITGTFATINWAVGPYFIKTETDPLGGTAYTITGTSQLLSVPYALHAKTASNVINETQNIEQVLTIGNNANANGINNLGQTSIGTLSANNSAILDVSSTNKGFLPPRMRKVLRNSISNPAIGLTVYCTDCYTFPCGIIGGLSTFTGTVWTDAQVNYSGSGSLSIGNNYQGGIIAYIYLPGDPGFDPCVPHGLIVPPTDQSTGATWGCEGIFRSNTCPISDALGTGSSNSDCINSCASLGTANFICYYLTFGGYSDWFLPSVDELEIIKQNSSLIGGFSPEIYWSSSEVNATTANTVGFGANDPIEPKSTSHRVRAARYF